MNYFYGFTLCLITVCTIETVHSYPSYHITAPPENNNFSMPESCKGKQKFCFSKDKYPYEIVVGVVHNIKDMEIDTNTGSSERAMSERQGFDEIDCLSHTPEQDELIYYIVDEFGRDRVVIQVEGKLIQRFNASWCLEPGLLTHKTTHFTKTTIENHKLTCDNKYIHYDFMVLSATPDFMGKYGVEIISAALPIYCGMHIQN